jgi:hypothetical protein
MSNTCSLCNSTYVWPADLQRHLRSKHGQHKSTLKQQQQPYTPEQQQQPYIPEQQQQQQQPYIPGQQQQPYIPEQQQQPYIPGQQQQQHPYTFTPEQQQQQQQQPQSNEEEPYYILKTNNPFLLCVPDGYDPDHFMPWVHPFTSVISGPTGSGKSVFVRRFEHNIKHMMTPIPDRILWCYGEYQTLYGTVDGVDFNKAYRVWII